MRLYIQAGESNWKIALKLTNDQFNVRTVAAIIRQLADYRFGADGQPLRTNHTNLSEWTLIDGLAMWHGYRYGVPDVSFRGIGFRSLDDFQNRCYTLDEFVNTVVQGPGASENVRQAIQIFKKYLGKNKNNRPSGCC